MKSLQNYLDDTRAHIIAQAEPAARLRTPLSGVDCLYLTDTGLRCAVGCHVPLPTLEQAAPDETGLGLIDVLGLISEEDNSEFFGDLQGAHDGRNPRSFGEMSDRMADEKMAEIGFVEGDVLDEHARGIWVTNTLARLDAVARLHDLS